MSVPANPSPLLRTRRRHDLSRWILFVSCVLVLVLLAPIFVARVYVHDDLGAYHLPVRAFYSDQLDQGEPFDWMPGLYHGFYLSGEGQAGMYHPFHWVLYRFLPLSIAWTFELTASYPFLFFGMYLFLRRQGLRGEAALFGSLVFTFSGFNLLHLIHPNAIGVIAHIPWLLWLIDYLAFESGRRCLATAQAAVALLTASQLLLGYPQYVWFSLLAETAFVVYVYFVKRSPVGRLWSNLATAKVLGLILGAIQLIPTADALAHSVRHSAEASFTNMGSLHPMNLIQPIAPYLFTHRVVGQNTHELGFYLGAVPLMLIVWLVFVRCRLGRMRVPIIAVSSGGLMALLLAFGKFGPFYWGQRFLPLVGSFRFPCRALVLCYLATAIVSAVAFYFLMHDQKQYEQKSNKPPWRKMTPLGIVFLVSLLAAVCGLFMQDKPFIALPMRVLTGPLLMGMAGLLVAWTARGYRLAAVALVLFTATDLGVYGLSYSAWPHTIRLDRYVEELETPPVMFGDRILLEPACSGKTQLRWGNQLTLAGWHRADGYAGLEPQRRLDLSTRNALRVAGVRWVRRSEAAEQITGLICKVNSHWLEVADTLPRVRLVQTVRVSKDRPLDLRDMPIETRAVVETPLALTPGSPGIVTPVEMRAGRFEIGLACPSKQLLVIAESFHPGWTAHVDGKRRDVLRVNGDFLGCVIGPEDRWLSLRFKPKSLRTGRIVSLFGIGLLGILFVGRLKWSPPCRKEPKA